MSITVDFAFNASGPLAAVQRTANSAIGVTLQPYEGDTDDLFCRFLGLELSLHTTAGLEDDRDLDFNLDFTRYGYLLSTRTAAPSTALRLYQVEATALAALSLLLVGGVRDGLLAYDLQTLLARYTVDGDAIHDAVSGEAVDLPQHLVDLRARVPR
jgi:hypothetical protein